MTVDIPTLHRTVTEHLGTYNAHVSWYLQHTTTPSVGHLADMIASRDRIAYRHLMADTDWPEGYAKDAGDFMPVLERKLLPLIEAITD